MKTEIPIMTCYFCGKSHSDFILRERVYPELGISGIGEIICQACGKVHNGFWRSPREAIIYCDSFPKRNIVPVKANRKFIIPEPESYSIKQKSLF